MIALKVILFAPKKGRSVVCFLLLIIKSMIVRLFVWDEWNITLLLEYWIIVYLSCMEYTCKGEMQLNQQRTRLELL